ncbi:Zinc finger C2HC domain-containing protein 1B [Fasciola gigantica]|uniref:Zinc finger C2HC domain-containing protein 1B n=1 Tax=Fasciola gigantica TaxID=46835 RepID=A0A504Y846_FASGI|nr:Zinc finger C2HC domain-containing protein 1B [Fasciola gigantica]
MNFDSEDDEDGVDIARYPCKICGRQFSSEILAKHETVCLKNARKKRKIFDSKKQRTEGIPQPPQKALQSGVLAERDYKLAQIQERKNQWRKKHEEFINAIRAAKEYSNAKKTGGPLPPPPPPTVDPDLIQCKFCLRRFNEKAAERHIKFCESQHNRVPAPTAKRGRGSTMKTTNPPGRTADENSAHTNTNSSGGTRGRTGTGVTVSPLIRQEQQVRTPTQPKQASLAVRNSVQSGTRGAHASNESRTTPQSNRYTKIRVSQISSSKTHLKEHESTTAPAMDDNQPTRNEPTRLTSGTKSRSVQGMRSVPGEAQSRSSNLGPPLNVADLTTEKNTIPSSRTEQDSLNRLLTDPLLYQYDPTTESDQTDDLYLDHAENQLLDNNNPINNFSQADQIETGVPDVRQHGVVLRSGRTHRDYLNARELARDLTRNPRSFIPVPKPDLLTMRSCATKPVVPVQSPNSANMSTHYSLGDAGANPPTFGHTEFPDNPASNESVHFTSFEPGQQPFQQQFSPPALTRAYKEDCELDYRTPMISGDSNIVDRFDTQPGMKASAYRNAVEPKPTSTKLTKFCYECGSAYPSAAAKFCPECGIKRLTT